MKTKISIILIISLLTAFFSGCSGAKEVTISYNEGSETQYADELFEQNNSAELKKMCQIMSGNNDDPETRDNFFYYMLIKIATIAENNEEDKFLTALDVLDTCIKLPLTQAVISDNMKKYYNMIDEKLTEKSRQYLIGKWKRTDITMLTGTTIEIKEGENGLEAEITGLPEEESLRFRIGDKKWKDIHFANHKEFFFSDLTTQELKGVENYYKDESSAVYIYSGATANINFDNNSITVNYEKDDMTSGSRQLWVKVGSENEFAGYDELLYQNQQAEAMENAEETTDISEGEQLTEEALPTEETETN